MIYSENNNDITFRIENKDSGRIRRLVESKCRALWQEIMILTELEERVGEQK